MQPYSLRSFVLPTLSYGLAIVLILIGGKMLLVDIYHVPVAWSLVATVTVLAATMVLSLYVPARGYTGSAYPFKAKPGKDGGGAKQRSYPSEDRP